MREKELLDADQDKKCQDREKRFRYEIGVRLKMGNFVRKQKQFQKME